jgi:1,4-alpha-glucan branching enzyme
LRGAVFDWDGTLVDIDEREFYCINQTLRAHNVRPIARDFFIHNARYWLEEYRLDGLRFDAVDQIKDNSTVGSFAGILLTGF